MTPSVCFAFASPPSPPYGVRYLRHHRCSLPWVRYLWQRIVCRAGMLLSKANRWANVFGFAQANPKGSDELPQVRHHMVFATFGSLPMVANSVESRYGFALASFATIGVRYLWQRISLKRRWICNPSHLFKPQVANRHPRSCSWFALKRRWFATFGSELFGEQVWICISLLRHHRWRIDIR